MDAGIRCPRCGKHGATMAVFVGPISVTTTSRCFECGSVICGTGLADLVRLVPFLHRPGHKTERSV